MTRKEWKEWKEKNYDDFDALVNLNYDLRLGITDNFVSSDEVDRLVMERTKCSGWRSTLEMLDKIKNRPNDKYFELDSSECLCPCESWESYADAFENEIDFDEIVCDGCGRNANGDEDFMLPKEWCKELGFSKEKTKAVNKYCKENFVEFTTFCKDCFDKFVKDEVGLID